MTVAETLMAEIVQKPELTVTEAAERLAIGRPALSRVLNGRAELSIALALRIEKQFGLDARKLLIAQLDEGLEAQR